MMPQRGRAFPEHERALLSRVAQWPDYPAFDGLTSDAVSQITRRQGVDFATALLFDRLRKSRKHSAFIEEMDSLREEPSSIGIKLDARIIIVPGALYRERPEMGGDGRLVRDVAEGFGYRTELIPTASVGSVKTNALLIREWLEAHARDPIIIVSLSKGGADLNAALSQPDYVPDLNNVAAWINVCGPLKGSRMANWVLSSRWRTWLFRLKFWAQRRDFNFITGLRADGPLSSCVGLPNSLRIITLMGFPLGRHMTTALSRFCHRILSRFGPNDGTTSLSDLRLWPGLIYPVWGMDHYFRPDHEARKLIAAVMEYLARTTSLSAASQGDHFSHEFSK